MGAASAEGMGGFEENYSKFVCLYPHQLIGIPYHSNLAYVAAIDFNRDEDDRLMADAQNRGRLTIQVSCIKNIHDVHN